MQRVLMVSALVLCSGIAGSAVRQGSPADFPRAAVVAIAHGQRAEALRLAQGRPAGDPDAAVILARLDVHHGKYTEAAARLQPAAARDLRGEAALELGLLDRTIGKRGDGDTLLTAVAAQPSSSNAAALFRAARAEHALGHVQNAKTLYLAAERAGADVAALETSFGTMFEEKYNAAEALKSFQRAIEADPSYAPAYAGMARVLADDKPEEAAAAAQKALAIDPELPEPHLLLASLHLDADRVTEARAEIAKVLGVNPSQLEAHALLAAVAYVKDDRAAYAREVAAALQVDPVDGEVYRIAGEQAAAHYRFQEAATLADQALSVDPQDTQAAADLGMHLLRTGDEPQARVALDRAWKGDNYNLVTFNLLQMMDKLATFTVINDGEFVFKMPAEQAPVLREYAQPLAHEAIASLSERYGFTPTGPILVEIFDRHDDFAVRNLGLPGMLGALGACFGRVVTMDSPTARNTPGDFSWEATLWHELTHVITIQMSQQRIPRWLTEGISVYEEGRHRPEWGRDMEVTFARAMDRGKVLQLKNLNAGFTRGDTIALAYYEASLLVDHIESAHGIEALRTLIRSYADGIDTDTAVTRALHVSMDDLQASFDAYLQTKFGAMARALHDVDTPVDARSVDALRANAAAKPESYIAHLALGEALAGKKDPAAFAPLQRASALVPNAIGPESPHAIMAALAQNLSDTPRELKEYEALLSADHTNVGAARALAALARSAGDDRRLELALSRIVAIDPFDGAAHVGLGQFELKQKDASAAAREFRAALATNIPDKAAAHCDLGESYLMAGRAADAKKEALAALEIAPSFERAQELLLNAKGGGQ